MIKSIEEKEFLEKRIKKLENILLDFKNKLLPDREEEYKNLSKVYVQKIIEMREEIEEYVGMSNVLIKKNDINIHIKGPIIGYGSAPISIISGYLGNFRKSIQKLYLIKYKKNCSSRIPKWLSSLTDFGMEAYQPGSINLTLSIPERQISFYEESNIESSLKLYFQILEWLNKDEDNDRFKDIDNKTLEKMIIAVMSTLPDNKNINSIEYFGRSVGENKKIYINYKSKENAKNRIKKLSKEEVSVEYIGLIREVDLDKLTFVLRNIENNNDNNEVKCSFDNEFLEDIKNYLDSKVYVIGIKKNKFVKVKYIDKIN